MSRSRRPPSRREALQAGALSALGLGLPRLLGASAGRPRAKNCIVVFLLGGPPQHSTWDPKPDAPPEVRGEFGPIDTAAPGVRIASLFPRVAQQADKICFLRGVSTGDNAHSSSGYSMLTGVPHAPPNVEGVNPGAPNDSPCLAAMVRRLRGDRNGLPGSVRVPMHIFNTDNSVWPGQDAGFLGRSTDPWLLRCEPAAPGFSVPELTPRPDLPPDRLAGRRDLLEALDRASSAPASPQMPKAFELLTSPEARAALDLSREPARLRERYGAHHFGQSCLMARRLIEAGVSLVQVNWYRGPEEPTDAPCWDSHVKEAHRLKTALAPVCDQGYSALIEDLSVRGLLDDTLVMCISEFGRSPKINAQAGRDHWGRVFSVALAGGGVQGGRVYGASDRQGGEPSDGRVTPADLTATALHCLGLEPDAEIRDGLNRPLPASRGSVIRGIL